MRSLAAIAVSVLLVAVAGCSARMEPDRTLRGSSPSNTIAEGDVTRVDPAQRVIVLNDGQMYQVPADSVCTSMGSRRRGARCNRARASY